MPKVEQLETDVNDQFEYYLAIARWDVPGIDEPLVNRLIIAAIRRVPDRIGQALPEFQPA